MSTHSQGVHKPGVHKPEVARKRTFTADSAAALARAGFSRRSFLAGAGALVVSFSMKGAYGGSHFGYRDGVPAFQAESGASV